MVVESIETSEQDVKMRLLKAAKKLFANQGFDGTSIRQICEEADANVALISYHFGGKDKIFQAIFETFYPNTQIEDLVQQPLQPVEGIRLLIQEVTYFRLKEPDLIRMLQYEILLNTPRIEIIHKHAFPVWKVLRDVLEKGRRQGIFHFESLDHTFLSTLGAILFHKKTEYFAPLLTEQPQTPERLIEDLTDYILGALRYTEHELNQIWD